MSDSLDINSDAKFLLIIEKEASFQRLLDDNVLQKLHPCIVITVSTEGISLLCVRRLSIKSSPTNNRKKCLRQSLQRWPVDNQMNQSGREATRVGGTKRGKHDNIQHFYRYQIQIAIFIVSIWTKGCS